MFRKSVIHITGKSSVVHSDCVTMSIECIVMSWNGQTICALHGLSNILKMNHCVSTGRRWSCICFKSHQDFSFYSQSFQRVKIYPKVHFMIWF